MVYYKPYYKSELKLPNQSRVRSFLLPKVKRTEGLHRKRDLELEALKAEEDKRCVW